MDSGPVKAVRLSVSSCIYAEAGKSSDVEFIQGDSFQVEKVLPSTFLEVS